MNNAARIGIAIWMGLCLTFAGTADGAPKARHAVPAKRPIMVAPAPSGPLAFPGAVGWAATATGGRGGQIVRVTTLAASGPGSLREAVTMKGARIVVFEVGGVIDLDRQTLKVTEPDLTIAGQTAPSPGITLIKGGIDVAASNVIIRHLRVRPGDVGAAKKSGWEEDAFSTVGAVHDVIVDHCTLTWGTDENMSASGLRFIGDTPESWREHTSRRITFSNNIAAESLAHATHYKIEHSKGSLIHDNATDILIYGNLYAHNYERNPLFKGGVRGAVVNNLIFDPGQRAIHYNLMGEEWGSHAYQQGQLVAVGNALRAGISTPSPLAFVELGGDGDLLYYGRDNIFQDRIGQTLPELGRYTTGPAKIIRATAPPLWPAGLMPLAAAAVERYVLHNAGARPWDRDADDVRLIADVAEGRGIIIDSQDDLHGYPVQKETHRPFNPADWDLSTMEPRDPSVLDSSARAKGT